MAEPATGAQTQDEGRQIRGLIRRARVATLATIGSAQDAATAGWPASALVTIAATMDGSPILLLSTLAHHTRNLMADARASLLVEETAGFANPQAGPRVSVMGRIERDDDAALARRFLARHPAAKAYAGFGDFAFYRMTVTRLHWVGGFARARWLDPSDVILPAANSEPISAHEIDILEHMNRDHSEALTLYARAFLKARARRIELAGVDPDGFDLRCGRGLHRIDFDKTAENIEDIHLALVKLASRAREILGVARAKR